MPVIEKKRTFQYNGETYTSVLKFGESGASYGVKNYRGIPIGDSIIVSRSRADQWAELDAAWDTLSKVINWLVQFRPDRAEVSFNFNTYSSPHREWLKEQLLPWVAPGWVYGNPRNARLDRMERLRQEAIANSEDPDEEPVEEELCFCDICGRSASDLLERDRADDTLSVCRYCDSDRMRQCGTCDYWVDVSADRFSFDWNRCGDCIPRNVVRSWDYRPELIFHPMPPQGANPMYIGMEIEASFRSTEQGKEWAAKWADEPGVKDLIYFKSDSSVNAGFEIVTHPMQPAWAMKKFPFHMFQNAIEEFSMKLTDESTGTHIHMNKEAFSPSVLWKFLQIHIKLSEFCGLVGGRGTASGFGSFAARTGRGDREGGLSNFLGANREQLLELAKKKGKFDNYERYVAVNLRNEYTLELRYMRGGTAPSEIKKNIQWAWCLYEFANYLDIRDVKEGALENPGYLLWYITQNNGRFPDLQAWVDKHIPRPIALRERGN